MTDTKGLDHAASRDADDTRTIDQGAQPEPRLFAVLAHRHGVDTLEVPTDGSLVLGRCEPADVIVDDSALSRRHARLSNDGDALVVEDLDSKNGVVVGGSAVMRCRLSPGESAQLGGTLLTVQLSGAKPRRLPSHEELRDALDRALVRTRAFGQQCALLLIATGDAASAWRLFTPLASELGDGGRLALYAPGILEALLLADADASSEPLSACAERLLDRARQLDDRARGALAEYPLAGTTSERLLLAARRALVDNSAAARQPRLTIAPAVQDDEAALLDQTNSPAMRTLLRTLDRAAATPLPLLVLGETGSGKELVAHAIHRRSPRASAPIRCVNCAALPDSLLEATLFGHERGAFTGAESSRAGLFEAADGGTLMLDEVGELAPAAQAALLRVLETGRFRRVGGAKDIVVDVRVVAATHRDLDTLVEDGAFRQDLLYRLDALRIEVPPLRARREDVPQLVARFLAEAREGYAVRATSIDDDALALLEHYDWPGNVRELRNVVQRAAALAEGASIGADDLPRHLRDATSARGAAQSLKDRIQRYEAELIHDALREAGWNQSEAARRLRMPLRSMVRKVQLYGLARKRQR